MESINNLLEKLISWVDELLGLFTSYSSNYAKYFVYALLLFVASKIFKVKVNLDTGGKK